MRWLTAVMLARYWVMAASSRRRRDMRTLSTGSSDGTWMRLPLAICSVSSVMRVWFFCSDWFIIAWYWLVAIRMISSLSRQLSHHRQGGVEQCVRDRHDLHVGLVHILVFDQVHRFLVLVDAAGRLPVGHRLVAQGLSGVERALVL